MCVSLLVSCLFVCVDVFGRLLCVRVRVRLIVCLSVFAYVLFACAFDCFV